jgi:hypothetical protein
LNAGVPFKKVEISRAVTAAFSGFTLNETGGNLSIEFWSMLALPMPTGFPMSL